jgi:hypothetical protein
MKNQMSFLATTVALLVFPFVMQAPSAQRNTLLELSKGNKMPITDDFSRNTRVVHSIPVSCQTISPVINGVSSISANVGQTALILSQQPAANCTGSGDVQWLVFRNTSAGLTTVFDGMDGRGYDFSPATVGPGTYTIYAIAYYSENGSCCSFTSVKQLVVF